MIKGLLAENPISAGKERLPFLLGFLFLSPLLAYFEGRNHLTYRGSLLQMYPSFFAHIQFMWSSQWLGRYGYHLWFLAFLILYCLLALPLFLSLKRDPGQRRLGRIAALCAARWKFIVRRSHLPDPARTPR